MNERELLQTVGRRIREIRKEKNFSQFTTGNMADLTGKQHMSRIEAGHNMQMFTLHRVSTAIELSMAYLLDIYNEIPGPLSVRKNREMDKPTVLQKIGARIIKLREEKNMSPEEFSKTIGKDGKWLERRELGTVDFTLNTLSVISKGLGVSMSFVVDIYDEIKKENS